MGIAKAKVSGAKVSFKDAVTVSKLLRRKKVGSVKNLLSQMLSEKKSIEGKYYTQTAEKFLEVVKAAEANAKQKNLNTEKLFIKNAKADRGYTFVRPKSRFKFRGRRGKITNLTVEVEER